jgi:hypothetical protein
VHRDRHRLDERGPFERKAVGKLVEDPRRHRHLLRQTRRRR